MEVLSSTKRLRLLLTPLQRELDLVSSSLFPPPPSPPTNPFSISLTPRMRPLLSAPLDSACGGTSCIALAIASHRFWIW
jgi:hypothetical protein